MTLLEALQSIKKGQDTKKGIYTFVIGEHKLSVTLISSESAANARTLSGVYDEFLDRYNLTRDSITKAEYKKI